MVYAVIDTNYLYQPLSPTTQTLPKRTAGEGQVGQKHP